MKIRLPSKPGWAWALLALSVIWFVPDVAEANGHDVSPLLYFISYLLSLVLRVFVGMWLFERLISLHRRVAGRRELAIHAAWVWFGGNAALLALLALTRGSWAPAVSDATVIYYQLDEAPNATSDIVEAFGRWQPVWSAGWVFLAELPLLLVISVLQAWFAYRHGQWKWSALAASFGTLLCLAAFVAVCPWIQLDYDNFHGDLLASALLFDRIIPVPNGAYTSLVLPWYWVFWLSSSWLLRLESRARFQSTRPARDPAAG